ncbi:LOW QUALITY PROTEIN: Na_Ca_ex domain-containing protein, partial [Cephalotus follicularis]
RSPQTMSYSILRKKSDPILESKVRFQMLRQFLTNLQKKILGTKLALLFIAIPLAKKAGFYNFERHWIFALRKKGLTPLAELVSFLTEEIFNGMMMVEFAAGGLLNATCGNATELIIAKKTLYRNKIDVLKYSLLGKKISNLLLVLGTSLLCGGLANLKMEQRYDRGSDQGVVCLCYIPVISILSVGIALVVSICIFLLDLDLVLFQRSLLPFCSFTHMACLCAFPFEEEEDEEKSTIGFWSAFSLVAMTAIIALLSEFVVSTIEAASDSWGISVSFISIILLPIVGNAAEHAGSLIFALKNKLDISLDVALGSASQISMFVVPSFVIVAWIMHIEMDLDFSLLETGSLSFTIIITAFTLQDGTSHYMKGMVLFLCYIVIAACFFVQKFPRNEMTVNVGIANSACLQ